MLLSFFKGKACDLALKSYTLNYEKFKSESVMKGQAREQIRVEIFTFMWNLN